MTEQQRHDPVREVFETVGRKVEAFMAGLDPDERQVFAQSLLAGVEAPPGEDTRGFYGLGGSFRPRDPNYYEFMDFLRDCTWQTIQGRRCKVCRGSVMYCIQ